MKTVLLLIGLVIVVTIVFLFSFFYRIGKPVNSALSDSYYHHAWKSKIIYSPMGNWFELGYSELEADPASFQVFSREFAKDASSVFWKEKKQAVDYSSFRLDEQGIPKDNFHVYYDPPYGDSLFVVADADPVSYRLFNPTHTPSYYRWGQDNSFFFLDGIKLPVDRQTFSPLNETIAADTTSIYILKRDNDQLAGTPGATQVIKKAAKSGLALTPISKNYLQMGNTLILSSWKTDFAMVPFDVIQNISVLDERNVVVNGVLVSDGKRMDGVDVTSLELVGRDHMKDQYKVYYDTEEILSADPKSFTQVYEEYSKDKKHVYYKIQILDGANPATFSYDYASAMASDGKLYFKDGHRVNKH